MAFCLFALIFIFVLFNESKIKIHKEQNVSVANSKVIFVISGPVSKRKAHKDVKVI